MTQIAAADAQAMNTLYASAVQSGAKTAGIVDKESPMVTDQAFKDHEDYISTVEAVLSGDKSDTLTDEERDITLD
jgi:hypothetical protein